MKQQEWATVILVAIVTMVFAFLMTNSVVELARGGSSKEIEKVPVAPLISPNVSEPSKEVYKDGAINPTVKVTIGNGGADSNPVDSTPNPGAE
jgi:hypothetical protein